MIRAKDIAAAIERYAPLALQESWDNSGFCIGDPGQEVRSVLVGFDSNAALIGEAVEKGVDMVITHHPLIFSGIKRISGQNDLGRAVIAAVKHDIVVYAAHTNIDKVINGVSGQMAARLDLRQVQILERDEEEDDCGLGVVGCLPEALSAEDFIALVKRNFRLPVVKTSQPLDKKICRVALCGGSGKSLIGRARKAGADAYVSGDITYHDFVPDRDLMIVDIGHYESEIDIVRIFYNLVKENFPNFAVQLAENRNLVYYF